MENDGGLRTTEYDDVHRLGKRLYRTAGKAAAAERVRNHPKCRGFV